MKINFFCDIKDSFMLSYLPEFIEKLNTKHSLKLHRSTKKIPRGEIGFYISCSKILSGKELEKHTLNIVAHPGRLPNERGSGVVAWKILDGSKDLTVTLFEPNDKIDAGNIISQSSVKLTGLELSDEIRRKQAKITFSMIKKLIKSYPKIQRKNNKKLGSYFKKRSGLDSELNINQTLLKQFNLLRICDNERYPAFFKIKNKKYIIKIFEK